jgi:hypothetical protein
MEGVGVKGHSMGGVNTFEVWRFFRRGMDLGLVQHFSECVLEVIKSTIEEVKFSLDLVKFTLGQLSLQFWNWMKQCQNSFVEWTPCVVWIHFLG